MGDWFLSVRLAPELPGWRRSANKPPQSGAAVPQHRKRPCLDKPALQHQGPGRRRHKVAGHYLLSSDRGTFIMYTVIKIASINLIKIIEANFINMYDYNQQILPILQGNVFWLLGSMLGMGVPTGITIVHLGYTQHETVSDIEPE